MLKNRLLPIKFWKRCSKFSIKVSFDFGRLSSTLEASQKSCHSWGSSWGYQKYFMKIKADLSVKHPLSTSSLSTSSTSSTIFSNLLTLWNAKKFSSHLEIWGSTHFGNHWYNSKQRFSTLNQKELYICVSRSLCLILFEN